jgi:hypothetical protein
MVLCNGGNKDRKKGAIAQERWEMRYVLYEICDVKERGDEWEKFHPL